MKLISPAARAAKYGDKDVWAIFTPLANQHKAGKFFQSNHANVYSQSRARFS